MENFTPKPSINTYFKTVYYYETKNDSKLPSLALKRKRSQSLTNNMRSQSSSHSSVCSSDTPKHH
jgi:hypothetical protein